MLEDASKDDVEWKKEAIEVIDSIGDVLYGRDEEMRFLERKFAGLGQKSIENEAIEVCLISGAAGTGKTALGRTLKHLVEADGGFYMKGQCETHGESSTVGIAVLDTALEGLVEDLLSRNPPSKCLKSIQTELNAYNIGLLEEVHPLLMKLVPKSAPDDYEYMLRGSIVDRSASLMMLTSTRSQYSFIIHSLLKRILQCGERMVIQLDDLDVVSEQDVECLLHVLRGLPSDKLLVVGTLRNDRHNICKKKKQSSDFHIESMNLEVSEAIVGAVLDATFQLPLSRAASLKHYLWSLGYDNLHHVKCALKDLVKNEMLVFDSVSRSWTSFLKISNVGVESLEAIVRGRIDKLSEDTMYVLHTGACFGPSFDLETLRMVLSDPNFKDNLVDSSQLGLIRCFDARAEFVSEVAHQMVYESLSEDEVVQCHVKIARRLLRALQLQVRGRKELLLSAFEQLWRGKAALKKRDDCISAARVGLDTGVLAAAEADFDLALTCFERSRDLLGPTGWAQEYELCLKLHNSNMEALYASGKLDEVVTMAVAIVEEAKKVEHTLSARAFSILALEGSGESRKAVEQGKRTLKALGQTFPRRPTMLRALVEMQLLRLRLKRISLATFARAPDMDAEHEKTMLILHSLSTASFAVSPALCLLCFLRSITFSLDHGLCPFTSSALLGFATMLCNSGYIEEGHLYGKLALEIHQRYKADVYLCTLYLMFYSTASCYKDPWQESVEPLRKACEIGLRVGDINSAVYCSICSVWNTYLCIPLDETLRQCEKIANKVSFFGQKSLLGFNEPLECFTKCLMAETASSNFLMGLETFDGEKIIGHKNKQLNLWHASCLLLLCLLLEETHGIHTHLKTLKGIHRQVTSAIDQATLLMVEALSLVQLKRQGARFLNRRIRWCLTRLRKLALYAPCNFQSHVFLVEAELLSSDKKAVAAPPKYMSAYLHAKDSGFQSLEAMSHELLAKHYERFGEAERAKASFLEAISAYRRWGADFKVTQVKASLGDSELHIVSPNQVTIVSSSEESLDGEK